MTQDTAESNSPEPTFAELGLAPSLLQALGEQGYESPTPIQAAAIPPLLEGRDLLGQAQTGTGKTAAFALPMLQQLDLSAKHVQAIVLTPTRELALQVAEAVRAYGKREGDGGVRVLPVYGGQPIPVQLRALKRGVHIVIGTPGRVKDHLIRKSLDLSKVHFFGLDEADEMLKMGFVEDVEWILAHAPESRQIALFSATLPEPIRKLADSYLSDPADVKIKRKTLTVPNIEQVAMRVTTMHQKQEALERILEAEDYDAVLVFARTQKACTELAERLQAHGYPADCIHGGISQSQREAIVRRLRIQNVQVLVATDVAARGLDVDHINLVVNYDIPGDQEVYVHRIGRTGRAGRSGKAITFWRPRERRLLKSIERYGGQPIKNVPIPRQAEVIARRRQRFVDRVRALIREEADEQAPYLELIAPLIDEGLEAAAIAAAAARLAWGDGPLEADEVGDDDSEPSRLPLPTDSNETEIVIPCGKWNQVRPGDILGAITGETGLPGNVVGQIRILERVTFVAVPTEHAEKIIDALDGTQIGGRQVRPRLAHPEGGGGGKRDGGGRKPYKHKDRDGDRKPRRGPPRGGRGRGRGRGGRGRGPRRGRPPRKG